MDIGKLPETVLFDEGSKAYDEKKWEESVMYFQELLFRQPTHIRARELLAIAQMNAGRISDCIANYDYLLMDDPENPDHLGGKGVALISIGREDEGIRLLEESLCIRNNMIFRGVLIRLRGEPIDILDIRGIGEKHKTPVFDGYISISSSDVVEEIALKCIEHKAMVKVRDVCREALLNIEHIEEMLELVAGNTGIQGNLTIVDDIVLIEFQRTDAKP